MTKESEAFLNALVPAEGSDVTDHTQAIYDLIEPLHNILDTIERHLCEIDRLRRAADRAESDPMVWGWFERFKQNIDGGKRLNQDALRSLEALSDLAFQMDRYAIEMRDTLKKIDAPEPTERLVKVLPLSEHEALVASRDEAHKQLAAALTELNSLKGQSA